MPPNPVDEATVRRWRERDEARQREAANLRAELLHREQQQRDSQIGAAVPRRPTITSAERRERVQRASAERAARAQPAPLGRSPIPDINLVALYQHMAAIVDSGSEQAAPEPVYNPDTLESVAQFNQRYRRWLSGSPTQAILDTTTVQAFEPSSGRVRVRAPSERLRYGEGDRVEQHMQFAFNGQKVALRLASDPGRLRLIVSTPRGSYSTNVVSLLAQHPLTKLAFYRERIGGRETSHGLQLMTRGETLVVMERKE